ncbi:MAG: homoserine dehydrogenase [Gemmatimonadota bacterium]|nr:homoserine dehydrogenase [Gemmatimonadota bacterium]
MTAPTVATRGPAVATTLHSHERHVSPDAVSPRTVRVALAGCGVVGSALVRLLHASAAEIGAHHNVRFEIARVLVRDVNRARDVPLQSAKFTSDVASFAAENVDVVIEAVGGREVALDIAHRALSGGRRFVTANKELIAGDGRQLAQLAVASGGSLDFGAAVGGSVPVISTLRGLDGTPAPASVRGILNGTSNYVLSLVERGATYDAALASARRRGLAEADCTRDLDGSDAAAKLAIIGWVCFGIDPAAQRIRRRGLLPDPARFVRHAAAVGARVRLLAESVRVGNHEVTASVGPVIVPLESAFARTELEDNRVEIDRGWTTPLSVSGPGAGGDPTATAILSDLLSSAGSRRHRSAASFSFTVVDDPRSHRWLIAGRLSAAELARAVAGAGVGTLDAGTDGAESRVITEPASTASLDRILQELRERGADPLVARSELGRPPWSIA